MQLGTLDRESGRTAEAESAFHKAFVIRETLVRDYPITAEYRANLAASYRDLAAEQHKAKRPAGAAAAYGKAIQILETLVQDKGQFTVARRSGTLQTRESLATDNSMIDKYRDAAAANYADLGAMKRQMGRAAEAQSAFRKAIELREKLVRDNPDNADYQHKLTASYRDLDHPRRDEPPTP